jgi:hypothetical protein
MLTVAVAEISLRGGRGRRGCGGGGWGRSPDRFRIRHGVAVTVEERPGLLSMDGRTKDSKIHQRSCAFDKARG